MVLISLPAFSQDDQWDAYIAMYEKGAGSTVVNMGAKNRAPVKEMPFVVITGVTFDDCSPDGLPSKSQFKELYVIGDSLDHIVLSNTTAVHAGTFTYQCERLDYYYVNDTSTIRKKLLDCYATHFPGYKYYLNIKEDKTWEAYLTFLYPNEETLEFMGNQKVVSKLQESGDQLDKPRKIDHWMYFKTAADQNCMLTYLKSNSYIIESKEVDKNMDNPFKLQISHVGKVDLPSINQITLSLRKQALKCNGVYDGWETFVVK